MAFAATQVCQRWICASRQQGDNHGTICSVSGRQMQRCSAILVPAVDVGTGGKHGRILVAQGSGHRMQGCVAIAILEVYFSASRQQRINDGGLPVLCSRQMQGRIAIAVLAVGVGAGRPPAS